MLGSNDFAPLFFVLIIVLVIGGVVYGHFMAKKRREEMARWASSIQAAFRPDKDWGLRERFGPFSALRQGSKQYAYNIVEGRSNHRGMCAFDYHYETYSTDSKGRRRTHHHYFSAVVIDSGLFLKSLFIRPEGFFDKVTEFMGWDDIDFESSEFSRKFYVKAPDKKWAFDVIHQATMEFMLSMPQYHLEFEGRHVIAWRKECFGVSDFETAMALIAGILDRLPEYLLRELKGMET